jgi:hypothetical protein
MNSLFPKRTSSERIKTMTQKVDIRRFHMFSKTSEIPKSGILAYGVEMSPFWGPKMDQFWTHLGHPESRN